MTTAPDNVLIMAKQIKAERRSRRYCLFLFQHAFHSVKICSYNMLTSTVHSNTIFSSVNAGFDRHDMSGLFVPSHNFPLQALEATFLSVFIAEYSFLS